MPLTNKPNVTNMFYKGIDSDTSYTEKDPATILDAQNLRVIKNDNNNLWIQTPMGMEKQFKITDNFIPLGTKSFQGVLFILSTNATTGEGEIGCYPYPRLTTEGYVRDYAPLRNFTLDNYNALIVTGCEPVNEQVKTIDFRTTSLGFRCDKPIFDIEIRIDFDGSVNLYWTDYNKPWRSVNCGFEIETGLSNNRFVSENDVSSGAIDGINENNNIPIVKFNNLGSGGNNKGGNYFYFVRYTDGNFNSTSFLGESPPVPVFEIVSYLGKDFPVGVESQERTSRTVFLEISNLDINAAFVEIGFLYYYSENEFEAKIIDKRYPISGNDTINVEITGFESLIDSTIDEITVYKPSDALYAKSIAQNNNKLYLANTRGPELDHPDLSKFFCQMEVKRGPIENFNLANIVGDYRNNVFNENYYGIDPKNVSSRAGYFRGETYCFCVFPVFKGGFIGRPYPMKGSDDYSLNSSNPNSDGIYRFPNASLNRTFLTFFSGSVLNNEQRVRNQSVTFDISNAVPIYNNSQWLQENLIGYYFGRTKRNKNLLYQALALRCYNGRVASVPNSYNIFTNGVIREYSDNIMPLFEFGTYVFNALDPTGILAGEKYITNINYPYSNFGDTIENKNDCVSKNALGLFSTEYYCDDRDAPENCWIERVGGTNWSNQQNASPPIPVSSTDWIWRKGNNFGLFPDQGIVSDYFNATTNPVTANIGNNLVPSFSFNNFTNFVGYEMIDLDFELLPSNNGFAANCKNINAWDPNAVSGFVSKVGEGQLGVPGSWCYEYSNDALNNERYYNLNAPIALPNYIAITNAPDYVPSESDENDDDDLWNRSIVNVCKSDPSLIDYTSYYDFKNEVFSKISDFIPIDNTLNLNCYQGDCFLSRTYLKIANSFTDELGDEILTIMSQSEDLFTSTNPADGSYDNYDVSKLTYGHWVSLILEQSLNPNYRHEKGSNLFFPAKGVDDMGNNFAWITDSPESNFYNRGYSRMLSGRQLLGIDLFQPQGNNRFATRIRPSLTHIIGGVKDGYKVFIPGDQKDFDFSYGPINKIVSDGNNIISFQDKAINLHPVAERVTQPTSSGSTAVLGESTSLTQYKQTLITNYGTQNQGSVIQTLMGIHCFDWRERAWILVSGGQVQILSMSAKAKGWINEKTNFYGNNYSDIIDKLPDSPICGIGINGAYNAEFGDVYMTFHFENDEDSKTLCFNEMQNAFSGTFTFVPTCFGSIGDDMYVWDNSSDAYIMDRNPDNLVFFDNLEEAYVKFVVNLQENSVHYDNMIIKSNNAEFSKIEYETQHQVASQIPFKKEFWYMPTYRVNEWRLPIRRADQVKEQFLNIYNPASPLRGTYLIVKLSYQDIKAMRVNKIITSFTESKI